jgi:hypothetical protein
MTKRTTDTMSDDELRRHVEIELAFIRSCMTLQDYCFRMDDDGIEHYATRHRAMRCQVFGCDAPDYCSWKYLSLLGFQGDAGHDLVWNSSIKIRRGPLVDEPSPTAPIPLRRV